MLVVPRIAHEPRHHDVDHDDSLFDDVHNVFEHVDDVQHVEVHAHDDFNAVHGLALAHRFERNGKRYVAGLCPLVGCQRGILEGLDCSDASAASRESIWTLSSIDLFFRTYTRAYQPIYVVANCFPFHASISLSITLILPKQSGPPSAARSSGDPSRQLWPSSKPRRHRFRPCL